MRNCAKFGFVILLFLTLLTPSRTLWAQAGVFTVSGVPVDVTGNSAVEARETAIAEAHSTAFGILLQRLVPQQEIAYLQYPSQREILNLSNLVKTAFHTLTHGTSRCRCIIVF